MFTTAFDASHDDHTFMVVAGFIAPADAWTEFDRVWRERLRKDGLSYFHMVDFAHSRKEFKHGWKDNEARRRALAADLMENISRYASRKFGWVVENELFAKHAPLGGWDQYSLDSFSYASMSCVADVLRWSQQEPAPKFETVRFVFEDGDGDGQKKLRQKFREFRMIPHFKFKKDTPTKLGAITPAFVPIQAADFLAYEVLKVCKELGTDNVTDDKIRWGIKEFQKMPGEIKIAVREVIVESASKQRISQDKGQ